MHEEPRRVAETSRPSWSCCVPTADAARRCGFISVYQHVYHELHKSRPAASHCFSASQSSLCLVATLCKCCDSRRKYCGTIFLHAECPCNHQAFLQPQQENSSYNGRWPHSTIQSATWASSELARLQEKQWMEGLLAIIPEGFKTIWMGFRHNSGSSGCQL